jgi:MoaA/NifB/PqqE/SkfB family radical SAM enzyme
MTLEMFRRIIDRYYNAIAVQIIGSGEPMLNKDFFGMVDYAVSRKMTVKTFSNGTTVAANIDAILASGLQGITVSLNGHNAQEFKRMTGMPEKTYYDVYDATKRLIQERNRKSSPVRVKLSYIIDKQNYIFMPEMAKVSAELGADFTFFCNFLACPYEGFTADERSLETGEAITKEIQGFIRSLPLSQRRKFDFPQLIDRNAKRFSCRSHFSQIRFDGAGNVSSCSMMLLDMGKKGNFMDPDAWNNEFFRSMRRGFLSGERSALHDPCLWCPDNVGVTPWE